MIVSELKSRVMFQTNNNSEDVGDFEPFLLGYINEGYDKMLSDALGVHAGDTGYPLLEEDNDGPVSSVPEWAHGAIADYATYRIYMNGSAPKQSRGLFYLSNFKRAAIRVSTLNNTAITNIPV